MAETIRLLMVDDHPVVRAGLRGMLQTQPDFDVVGEAGDGIEALDQIEALSPDVVLLDLRMPEMDGVSVIEHVVRRSHPPRILVLTTYETDADILRAIGAGATGYLLKDAPRDDLFRAIRATARGESVLAPSVAERLAERDSVGSKSYLSHREIEVLTLVAQGNGNKEIARQLHISQATVKTHLLNIFGKLDVADRAAAVAKGLSQGIIQID